MTDGNYKTSIAYICEVQRTSIAENAAPAKLITLPWTPAPEHLSKAGPTAQMSTLASGRGNQTNELTYKADILGGNLKASVATRYQKISLPSKSIPADSSGNASEQPWVDDASALVGRVGGATGYAEKIATMLQHGAGLLLHFPHQRNVPRIVLKRIRVIARKAGKLLEKGSDVLETAQQLGELYKNVHAASGKIHNILNSQMSWDIKTAKLGAECTAVSLKTIAKIGWEGPHAGIAFARNSAAFFGADVTHPGFGTYPPHNWRAWTSWQAVNYLDARIGYLTDAVYDGDKIYILIQTNIQRTRR